MASPRDGFRRNRVVGKISWVADFVESDLNGNVNKLLDGELARNP